MHMDFTKVLIAVVAVALLSYGVWFVTLRPKTPAPAPTVAVSVLSFEDCLRAGYPVMESQPRQCKTPDGRTYAEEIPVEATYINASAESITIDTPFPGAVTGKSITVMGKARGMWYFEASFPIELRDKNGKVIATGIAQAQGEWMTTEFVAYKAQLTAPSSYIGPATLVLKKDNPSGLPDKDASMTVPITVEY